MVGRRVTVHNRCRRRSLAKVPFFSSAAFGFQRIDPFKMSRLLYKSKAEYCVDVAAAGAQAQHSGRVSEQ